VDQQIYFGERSTTCASVAEEKFKFYYIPAIGDEDYIVAKFVWTIVARFDMGLNVRS
jgi:hypothetical protein